MNRMKRVDESLQLVAVVVTAMVAMLLGGGVILAQDPARGLYDEARGQFEWGEYEEAVATCEELMALYPTSDLADDAQYMIGRCYIRMERYEDATFAFYAAAYGYPDGDRAPGALNALAGNLYRLDHEEQALESYQRLADAYPDSEHAAYAQTCIASIYGDRGDAETARAELEKVAANYPDSTYAEAARVEVDAAEAPFPLHYILFGVGGLAGLGAFGFLVLLLLRRSRPAPASARVSAPPPRRLAGQGGYQASSPTSHPGGRSNSGFEELERRYYVLKGKQAAGRLSDEQFQAEVGKLRLQDEQGRFWTLGGEAGTWYVAQGGQWVRAEPPHGASAGGTCPSCGARVKEGLAFCTSCGQRLMR